MRGLSLGNGLESVGPVSCFLFVYGVPTGGDDLTPAGRRGRLGQVVAQVLPLRVNAVGAVLVAPLLPMKPTVTEPPAGMVEV